MIKKIEIDGLLSFENFELELRNLNVLIGPNGSGKSNLLEALSLLQALPTDIGEPIRSGGGISAWLRKANRFEEPRISVTVELATAEWTANTDYCLSLTAESGRYAIAEERLATTDVPEGMDDVFSFFDMYHGQGRIFAPPEQGVSEQWEYRELNLSSDRESVLHEVRDPIRFITVSTLANALESMRLYRDWGFGHKSVPRTHQQADLPLDFLSESVSNLALIINQFINSGSEDTINAEFSVFYERFHRFTVEIFGNQVLLNMHEDGLSEPVPATRWSDGMIRYLSLLAILCHPTPPPLVCIDEPDLGLHPDILPHLARLIKDMSERTQLIITTHSRELIDGFSDDPGAVVVCERDFDGVTGMNRLDAKRLKKWLKDYTLGELWGKGEIGGNRY